MFGNISTSKANRLAYGQSTVKFSVTSTIRAPSRLSDSSSVHQKQSPVALRKFAAAEETKQFDWLPTWRDKADCGPNALYVLMNLEGHSVKLEEVKRLVPLDDTRGCSIEALITAAKQLDFPLEARFVKPGDIHKLPRPFILHGITMYLLIV